MCEAYMGYGERGMIMRVLVLSTLIASFTAFSVAGELVTITAPNGVYMRQTPSTDSKALDLLDYGQVVAVVDDEPLNGWWRIEGDGYVKAEHTARLEYLGEWRVTAYAETGYCCANGAYPTVGYTIACNSLEFGTEVYIEGVGFRTVEDRGPAWLGDAWCDLYLGVYEDCVAWGDQTRKAWRVK